MVTKKIVQESMLIYTTVLWGPPSFSAADLWRGFERISNKIKNEKTSKSSTKRVTFVKSFYVPK